MLQEYSPLTWIMGPTINLIYGTYGYVRGRKYAFTVLLEYSIIIKDYMTNKEYLRKFIVFVWKFIKLHLP